jgi:hypothetical protein
MRQPALDRALFAKDFATAFRWAGGSTEPSAYVAPVFGILRAFANNVPGTPLSELLMRASVRPPETDQPKP